MPLPPEAIKLTVVNTDARLFLAPENWYFASSEYLEGSCLMSVRNTRRNNSTIKHALTSEGRSVPVATLNPDTVSYSGMRANWVTAKGGFVSGLKYADAVRSRYVESDIDPIGFFGDFDAASDIATSNTLLKHGVRASLALGYVILDSREILKFMENNWRQGRFNVSTIIDNINSVKLNGDELAILFRLSGARQRLTSTIADPNEVAKKSIEQDEFFVGLNNLAIECTENPQIGDCCKNAGLTTGEASHLFALLVGREKLTGQQSALLHRLISEIEISQAINIVSALKATGFSHPLTSWVSGSISKDTSADLRFFDFEWGGRYKNPESTIRSGNPKEELDSLPKVASWVVQRYFRNLGHLGLIEEKWLESQAYLDQNIQVIKRVLSQI